MNQYTLRIAEAKDAIEIWQMMDSCRQQLENQSYFICDNQYYVTDVLTVSGFGVVACDFNQKIVGNLLVKYPGMEEENLGYDLAFDFTRLAKVVHMDSCSVLPEARGNGLQERLLRYAESLIDSTRYTYLLATASPDNVPSMKTFTKLGYEIKMTKEKYEGVLRNILMKKI